MQQFREPVLNTRGEPDVGVWVTVRKTDGTLATLFDSDGVTIIDNPVKTNNYGEPLFKAANGTYSVIIAEGSPTARTVSTVLNDPTDLQVSIKSFGALGNGSSCVAAMRAGIAYLSANGGGTLFLPDGLYALDAATLISDPSPTTSLYRYWFQAASNVSIVGGRGAVLRVDNNVVIGDSTKQYCKGYQIFWAWSISTVDSFSIRGFTIDGNGVNNLAPAKNGYGSGIQTHVVVTNCGTRWGVRDIHIKGISGYQCIAFYLGASDIDIAGNRFSDMATAIPGNTLLTDHSTIYIEANTYRVSDNKFINTNYDTVATCIETHGFDGIVTKNIGHRYNLGMLRAAMLGDSYNVTNEGNVFSDCTVGIQFDAGAGYRLEALIKGNQFRFRDYAQRGTRTMNAVNTGGGFTARNSSNYARIIIEGNTFTADSTATAAGVKYTIGGNVDWLELRRNSVIGFTNYYSAGNFADNSTVVIDGDYVSGALNYLVSHESYNGAAASMHVDYKISNVELAQSSGLTAFIRCGYDNANIRYVTITGLYPIAIAPYSGFFNVINTAYLVDYTTLSMAAKGVAPFVIGKIFDVTHNATFFREDINEPQRWRIRRTATSIPVAAFAIGDDHQGDIVTNRTPTASGVSGWVCTTASGGAGIVGTWKTYGAISA